MACPPFRSLLLPALALAAVLSSGCASWQVSRREGGPNAYWQDIQTPDQVLAAYVSALMDGDLPRARAYLYLPPTAINEQDLLLQLAGISRALQQAGPSIRVADSRQETRISLVLYSMTPQGTDPTPVFLLLDAEGRWRLHHRLTAGPLKAALRDRHDVLEVRALALWGAQRMAEIDRAARGEMPSAGRDAASARASAEFPAEAPPG
jgi:hypothetical protein